MFGEAAIAYTVGEPGAGKSLRRCAMFLADEYLPGYTGRVWCNYPIRIPEMAAFVSRKTGRPAQEYADRIKLIPREVLIEWRRGTSGPWEFFDGMDISGDIICIDEIHKFIPRRSRQGAHKDNARLWEEFLSEVRHRQASLEVLTQDPSKVNQVVEAVASVRIWIQKDETRLDPLFKISMKAWYELIAAWITRRYEPRNWFIEQTKLFGKWVTRRQSRFRVDSDYFGLYDSYSIEDQAGKLAKPMYEFQRRSRLGVTWWFLTRNPSRIFLVFICAILFWMLLTGRLVPIFVTLVHDPMSKLMTQGQRDKAATPTNQASPAVAGSTTSPAASADVQPAVVPLEQHRALQARLALVEAQREALEQKLGEASAVLMISGKDVTFADGYTATVGGKVMYGQYEGAIIESIDYKQRSVRLDDGRILRMGGGVWGQSIRAAGTPDAGVSGSVSAPSDEPPPVKSHRKGK